MQDLSQAAIPNDPLIDYRKFKTFIIMGPADYHELLADVIHEVPVELDRLRNAIQAGDILARKTSAHSLRGILGYFGCVAMTSRLVLLDNDAPTAPDQASTIHDELLTLWTNSLTAIHEWEKSVPEFSA